MTQAAEQFVNSSKAAVADLGDVAALALNSYEKLVALNLSATKTFLADSAQQVQSAFAAKTPQDFIAAQQSLVQPLVEKTTAYTRAVYDIAAETGAGLNKAAEGKLADASSTVKAALDASLKYAPAGSEVAVTAIKDAVTAGQKAIDAAQASAKKTAEIVEKNVAAAAEIATNAAKSAVKTK